MTADGEATGRAPRRSWFLRHWYITLLLLLSLGVYVLQEINQWGATSGTPVPQNFTVLIYNKTANRIIAREYGFLDEAARQLKSEGAQYTYLLPHHPARYYPYADNDSFVSVKRVSNQEQVITFNYEIALLNHGWSKYRATDKTITPVSEEEGGDFYDLLAFAIAIIAGVLAILVTLVHLSISLVRKR